MSEDNIIQLVTAAIESITAGNQNAAKEAIAGIDKNGIPSDDLKKLFDVVAVLAQKQDDTTDFILNISHGNLEIDPPRHNQFISPFQRLSQSLKDKETIQKALHESEALYRVTLNASPDGILLCDIHGQITMASLSVIKLLGCENELDLLGEKLLHFIVPDDWDRFISYWERMMLGEKPQIAEYKGKHIDGSFFDMEITGDLIKDKIGNISGIIFDIRNISDRNLTKVKLKESEQRYRLLIETANEGILVAQGIHLKFVNPKMLEITGYGKDELYSIPFLDLVHQDDRDFVISNYEKRIRLEYVEPRYQFRILTKDNDIKWVEVSGAAIDWDGNPATFNFMTDISERKKTELQIKLKNEELLNLNAEKDKLFSIVAHDLRSPFGSFMKYTEMMAEDLYNMCLQEIQNMAVEMKESAINLNALLENLLEWSRMQSGLISFVPSSFLLKSKISESIALILQAAEKKDIVINYDIPPHLMIDADENMFKSIVRNLTFNAVKFTHRGGLITIRAKIEKNDAVEISIADSGIGISNDTIGKLFRLNKRTSRVGTEGEPSTGLGLILCKDFVEKHGGKIWAESEEAKGSTFYFTIPIKE